MPTQRYVPSSGSHRLSRRSILRSASIGALGLSGAALLACGGSNNSNAAKSSPTGAATTSAPSSVAGSASSSPIAAARPASTPAAQAVQPKRGGTLRVVNPVPTVLDVMTRSDGTTREFGGAFYPTLIQPSGARWPQFPASTYQPNLAALPETPDPLTYIFKLNSKASWSAPLNRPVTSADVVASLNRFFAKSGGTPAPQVSDLQALDTFEAPDAQTISMHLKSPFAPFIINLASDYTFGVMPAETGSSFDATKSTVSAGPWLLDQFNPPTSYRWVPNKQWFQGPDKPYLDAVEFSNVPQYATQLSQFKAGNIDWMASVTPGDLKDILSARPGSQLRPQKGLGYTYLAFGEPRSGGAPWSDARVRQAMSLCLDRDSMLPVEYDTDSFKGFAANVETGIGGSLDPKTLLSWHNTLPAGFPNQSIDPRTDQATGQYIKLDLTQAKQLLSAAGFANGFSFDLHYMLWSDALKSEVELTVEQLAKAGIKANPVLEDAATYLAQTFVGNFSGVGHFLQGYAEHSQFLTAMYHNSGGRNHSRVNDPDITPDVVAIEQQLDNNKRFAMTKAIQSKLGSKMWYVPTVGWQVRWDVTAPKLQGIYDFQTYRGGNATVEKANLWFSS